MTSSKRFWRGWFFLLLISALCGGLALPVVSAPARAAPQMQAATSVVISEFRTTGPSGGSDEFIELYNPASSSIPIASWQLKVLNGTGSQVTRATIPAGTNLGAGQHFLIANTNYNGSVVPDLTYGTGIIDNGGIAVFDNLGNRIDSGSPSDPQNSSSPITTCGNPTQTPSPTSTNTLTLTSTVTNTPSLTPTRTLTLSPTTTGTATNSPTPTGFLSILINEVAWAGTAASTSDEWIELYNPGTNPVNLTGWILKGADGTPNIALTGTLPAGGYFLLERTDDNTVSDIAADQIFSGDVGNTNESLQLWDPSNRLIDTANSNGGNWPAGSSTTFGSMERRAVIIDSDTAWITNTGVVAFGKDANGVALKGTPKHPNWAVSVTATPSPTLTPTKRPTSTRTPTPLPPPPLVAINEFVPRPGHDWNNDDVVNVGDEYIELLNHGVIDVNLSGYSLDDLRIRFRLILCWQNAILLGIISGILLTGIRQGGLGKNICLKTQANGLCLLIK